MPNRIAEIWNLIVFSIVESCSMGWSETSQFYRRWQLAIDLCQIFRRAEGQQASAPYRVDIRDIVE